MTEVQPRQARLFISRLDPWSVAKVSFMLSLALGVVIIVAVAVLWWTLDYTGVFVSVSRTVNEVLGNASTNFDLLSLLSFQRVIGVAVVIASVEVILVSAVSTLFAFMYNLSVSLTGGVEVVVVDET